MGGNYWLASYPKSGNTWLRSFLAHLQVDGEAPQELDRLPLAPIASLRRHLDEVLCFDTADLSADEAEALRPAVYRWSLRRAEPTLFKIHDAWLRTAGGEPLTGAAGTLGAIYLVRNPLDVAPSYACHRGCSLDQAIAHMADPGHALPLAGTGPHPQVRQRLLSWSAHVLSWVDAPDLNRLVLRYEDLLAQPQAHFASAARFLGLPCDAARVERAVRRSAFAALAAQEARHGFNERPATAARFFRQGRSGAWREVLSPAQVQRLVADHGPVMQRFGYLDDQGLPS